MGYDAIGNIEYLNRNGFINAEGDGTLNFGKIDALDHMYIEDSRELIKVEEGITSNTKGYPVTGTINHDGSGRMILENGKGIGVEYNLLNLPRTLTSPLGTGTETVSNTYTASGRKIKKRAPNAEEDMEEREYAGAIEYLDERIESIFHPEGRIVKNEEGEWVYEYAIKDHLGSTRVVFADIDDDGEVTYEEVLHENHYYPFGMNMEGEWTQPNPDTDLEENAPFAYQYTGKELNVGVEWTDYGARWYDAQIGRFTTVDPLAIERSWLSPYNYVQNHPVNRIDPTGALDEPPINGLEFYADDTGTYYWNNDNQNYDHFYTVSWDDQIHIGTYSADNFQKPVGNYTIIYDLSGEKTPDQFDPENSIKSLANTVLEWISTDDSPTTILTNQQKYPGVEIYSNKNMNGAVTLGNVIFTNPGMSGANTLDHEYGHYLDFKFHFQYNQAKYLREIGLPSILSATKATLTPHIHSSSESEMRANILGGTWTGNRLY